MELQEEQIAQLRQENDEIKPLRESIVPDLLDSGLIAQDPGSGIYQVAADGDQQEAFKEFKTR